MNPTHLAPVPPAPSPASAGTGERRPAPTRPTRRSMAYLGVVCLLYAGAAVLQTAYGTLLSDVGLTGGAAPVAAAFLGAFDIAVVTALCLLIVWSWGKALGAPGPHGPGALAVVSLALVCSAVAELGAVVAELAVTGNAPVVLATSPARWTDVPVLGCLSLTNATLYVVLGAGLWRDRGWTAPRAAVPVLTIAALAAGTAALS